QILRGFDAGIDVDESKAVAKAPVQEDRNRRQRLAVIARHQIAADVELADVELPVARHAPVAFPRPVPGEHDQLQTVRLHCAFLERADDFVIAHGDGKSDSACHWKSPHSVEVTGFETQHSAAPFPRLQFPYSFCTKPSFSISSITLMSTKSAGFFCGE